MKMAMSWVWAIVQQTFPLRNDSGGLFIRWLSKYGGLDDQCYIISGFMKTRYHCQGKTIYTFSKAEPMNKGEENIERRLGRSGWWDMEEEGGCKLSTFPLNGGWETWFNTPSHLNYILFFFFLGIASENNLYPFYWFMFTYWLIDLQLETNCHNH